MACWLNKARVAALLCFGPVDLESDPTRRGVDNPKIWLIWNGDFSATPPSGGAVRQGLSTMALSRFIKADRHGHARRIPLKILKMHAKLTGNDNMTSEAMGVDIMDFGLLDTLRKLAYVLVIPMFAAANLNDYQMLNEHYQMDAEAIIRFTESSILAWLLNSSDFRLWGIGWGLFVGIYVVMTGFLVFGSALIIEESDRWVRVPVSSVFGVGCMLAGLLFIAGLAAGAPIAQLNMFWNGGLICFGFILLDS
jgi:hypothetical protein